MGVSTGIGGQRLIGRVQRRPLLGDHLVSAMQGSEPSLVLRLALLQRDDFAALRNHHQQARGQLGRPAILDHSDGFVHHRLADIDTLRFSRIQIDAEARKLHVAIQMRRNRSR